jgi:hypothetical protein
MVYLSDSLGALEATLFNFILHFRNLSREDRAWKQELDIAQSHDITKSNFGFEEWI